MFAPISLAGRRIEVGARPLVIAELSGNHNGSLERALALVDAAAEAGADAVKLQTYTADTMTLDLRRDEFLITDPASPWTGLSLHELYRRAHTPWEWHRPIFQRCREHGLIGFSSPFDESAVDLLESLEVPCYKVASLENTDLPLIRRLAATGKPLIISTGLATVAELDESVRAAREAGCRDLVLLKCTASYPASPADSHLRTIPHLQALFDCPVGLSDHTPGIGVAVAAVALGACVVEKHLTLSRAEGGVDADFSLEPAELAALVRESARAWEALGGVHYGPATGEHGTLRYRRSLYIGRDVPRGEPLTEDCLRTIRPGLGLAPKHREAVLGRRARRDLRRGTPLAWDLVE